MPAFTERLANLLSSSTTARFSRISFRNSLAVSAGRPGKSTLSSVLVGNPAFEVTKGSVTFYVFHHCRFIVNIHIRESMRTAFISQQERITLAIITGIIRFLRHTYQPTIGVLTMSGGWKEVWGDLLVGDLRFTIWLRAYGGKLSVVWGFNSK